MGSGGNSHSGAWGSLRRGIHHEGAKNTKGREDREDEGHVYTGLLYYDDTSEPLEDVLHLGDKPLAMLGEDELRPPREAFDSLIDSYC